MLEIKDLVTCYGPIEALKGVSLKVEAGSIVSIIGANGAGKTTLLRTISGLLKPRAGKITFLGQDITGVPPDKIVGLGISQVPEGRQVFGPLSVYDNLLLGTYPRKVKRNELNGEVEMVYSLFPILNKRKKQAAGTLSGGEQQMLAIGRALMAKPKLLLMDEPSMGLAPLVVREIFRITKELAQTGATILLVEQNARAALQISSKGYVLEIGKIVMEGGPHELLAHEEVKQAYLGRTNNAGLH